MVALTNLAVVAAVAFGVPLLLALVPRLRIPSLALELVAGIVIGPQVLGLAEVDAAVGVMAVVGVAFLLLIAGLEIDFERLRGPVLGSRAPAGSSRSRSRPGSASCSRAPASWTRAPWSRSRWRRRRSA